MAEDFGGYDVAPARCGDAHAWWWVPSLCPVCHPGPGVAALPKTDTKRPSGRIETYDALCERRRLQRAPSDDPYLRRWGLH